MRQALNENVRWKNRFGNFEAQFNLPTEQKHSAFRQFNVCFPFILFPSLCLSHLFFPLRFVGSFSSVQRFSAHLARCDWLQSNFQPSSMHISELMQVFGAFCRCQISVNFKISQIHWALIGIWIVRDGWRLCGTDVICSRPCSRRIDYESINWKLDRERKAQVPLRSTCAPLNCCHERRGAGRGGGEKQPAMHTWAAIESNYLQNIYRAHRSRHTDTSNANPSQRGYNIKAPFRSNAKVMGKQTKSRQQMIKIVFVQFDCSSAFEVFNAITIQN